MAPRKKSRFHKRFIWIPAIAITGIALVFLFPTIQALQEINPQYVSEDFTVPELSVQEKQSNEEVYMMIEEINEDQNSLCGLSQEELDEISQCEELTENEEFVTQPPENFDPNLIINCGLTQSQIDECTSEIQQIINNLSEEIIENEIPMNETEFSDDPPEQQLCDLTECPEASGVSLEAQVVKVASNGQRFETVTTFDLPLQSIFVEDSTNIDFRNGFIEIELVALTDPDVRLSGSGQMDLLVGGTSVLQNLFDVTVASGNNTDGKVQLLINDSERISISFDSIFNSFPDGSVTPIEFKIVDLEFTDERNIFKRQDFVIFTMEIFRDDLLVIIDDEQGNKVRSLPLDSRIVVHSSASQSQPYADSCTSRIVTWQSDFYGNGLGCSLHYIASDQRGDPCIGNPSMSTISVPAPSISASISDSQGNQLASGSGSGNSLFDFDMLTRNATYTLSVTGVGSTVLDYGLNQETKSFTCTQEGIPNLKSQTTTQGNTSPCSTYRVITTLTLNTANPLTLGSKMCNFP